MAAAADVTAQVDFGRKLQAWDGFGINYVEVAQTRDYQKQPQEYGGFSTLTEEKRKQILDMIFGPEGLRPSLIKMFLDPWHEGVTRAQQDNRDPHVIDQSKFDHARYTKWMRYFVHNGLERLRAQRIEPKLITTLYGPPAWGTRQQFMRGRDIDMSMKEEIGEYMIAWVKYLRDTEKIPVHYLSLHNEGEALNRWPVDGTDPGEAKHDYNAHWHNTIVVDFLRFLRPMLDKQGLQDVGLTPGETTSWDKFAYWGYAYGIWNDPLALKHTALITSHGFGNSTNNISVGADLLRTARPELHAWTTSMTWGKMDTSFLELIRQQIYSAKVNGVIPWAAIQTLTWYGGDPNPGTAFRVENGDFTVLPGYYLYKHVSRAGQPGMSVAAVASDDENVRVIAFARGTSTSPDAAIVFNTGTADHQVSLAVSGAGARSFRSWFTGSGKKYESMGSIAVKDGKVGIALPAGSVITLYAE